MTFERIVRHTFDAIQFNGNNLKEVYEFICENGGNANDVTFEEFQASCRPKEIPLDVSSSIEYYTLEKEWKEKWKDVLDEWRKFEDMHTYVNMEDHPEIVPPECIKERNLVRLYSQDWRRDELYHFYLTDGEFCRLVGICVGDWFTTYGDPVEHCSDEGFKSLCEDRGWKQVE